MYPICSFFVYLTMKKLLITIAFIFGFASLVFGQLAYEKSVIENERLYFKLENRVKLNLPPRVKAKKIRLELKGGNLIDFNPETQVVVIQPIDPQVELDIFYKKKLLESRNFVTALVPRPKIDLLIGNKSDKYSYHNYKKKAISLDAFPRSLSVEISQNEELTEGFKEQLQYQIIRGEVLLLRAGEVVVQEAFTGNKLGQEFLGAFQEKQQAGDKLQVLAKEVVRQDAQGNKVPVKLGLITFELLLP